jgi:hypothetical protein
MGITGWENTAVTCLRISSLLLFRVACTCTLVLDGGCMHRRFIIKKTWLSAFSCAQSRISLVICRSLGFLVLRFSSLID